MVLIIIILVVIIIVILSDNSNEPGGFSGFGFYEGNHETADTPADYYGGIAIMNKRRINNLKRFYDSPEYREALASIDTYDNSLSTASDTKLVHTNIFTFDDIKHKMDYRPNTGNNLSLHIGQLKLLLSELQFLTEAMDNPNDEAVFVYMGSAPSHHLPYINKWFPNVKFLLFDPAEHYLWFNLVASKSTQYSKDKIESVYYMKIYKGNRFDLSDRKFIGLNFERPVPRTPENVNSVNSEYDALMKLSNDKIAARYVSALNNHKYVITEGLFSSKLASVISLLKTQIKSKLYFCSDIRSNIHSSGFVNIPESVKSRLYYSKKYKALESQANAQFSKDSSNYELAVSEGASEIPEDIDIIWNAAQQFLFTTIISPDYFVHKFRMPFYLYKGDINDSNNIMNVLSKYKIYSEIFDECKEHNVDFISAYHDGKMPYFNYTNLYIQAFAGETSTESRLVSNSLDVKMYEFSDYESKFFFYNSVYRLMYFNEQNKKYFDDKIGLDGCNDCAIMLQIITNYNDKYANIVDRRDLNKTVVELCKSVDKILRSQHSRHGDFITKRKISDLLP